MIAVVCHDAGGAEIVSSWLLRQREPFQLVLDGPAVSIFERKLPSAPSVSLDQAVEDADWMLCGTSWSSDLEWQAIGLARQLGKRSVAYLDHWENYASRFVRQDQVNLPDEFWAGDGDAEALARSVFPGARVSLVPNAYFEDFAVDVARLDRSGGRGLGDDVERRLLFIGENQSGHGELEFGDARHFGYTEVECLAYLLANVQAIGVPVSHIRLRPHPSETVEKYTAVLPECRWSGLSMELSEGTLAEDVSWSDVVAGGTSVALVLAAAAGRLAVSCIPDLDVAASLPGDRVRRLTPTGLV